MPAPAASSAIREQSTCARSRRPGLWPGRGREPGILRNRSSLVAQRLPTFSAPIESSGRVTRHSDRGWERGAKSIPGDNSPYYQQSGRRAAGVRASCLDTPQCLFGPEQRTPDIPPQWQDDRGPLSRPGGEPLRMSAASLQHVRSLGKNRVGFATGISVWIPHAVLPAGLQSKSQMCSKL